MADWFRKTTWTEKDKAEFFAKLNRARAFGRPQYLVIQACTLIDTESPNLLDAAESLLEKFFNEYPDNETERSLALGFLGEIYRRKQQYDRAIEYLKKAVDFEKEFPYAQTNVHLDFSELVVKQGRQEYYDFAHEILSEGLEELLILPEAQYRAYSIMAIIHRAGGNQEKADHFAALADEAATAKTSGLRNHKSLGLVLERDELLDRLAKGKQSPF